jgi:hypothetical protein
MLRVSLLRAPEPRILSRDPGGPLLSARVIPAPIVILTGEALILEGPEAVILLAPAVVDGTVKLAVQFPWLSAEIPEATVVPTNLTEIPLSLAPNAAPLISTMSPGAAVGWPTVNVDVTSKVAEPLPPETVIDLDPPGN